MKGIVFTEFLEMVEEEFSPEIADKIIQASNLKSDGAYTSVGTYSHKELIDMVLHLSEESDIDVPSLVKTFGRYMFGRFHALYPIFFAGVDNVFAFLESIENHVHVEVRKLYPDAELPTFATVQQGDDELVMTYKSMRPFAPLAEGLIEGSIQHFGEKISMSQKDLCNGANTHVEFHLKKIA